MPSLTRRQLLMGGSAVGVAAVAGGFTAGSGTGWAAVDKAADVPGETSTLPTTVHRFVTRPDLRPPQVRVLTRLPGVAPGYVLCTVGPTAPGTAGGEAPEGLQAGALVVDNDGEPVWFAPSSDLRIGGFTGLTANLRVQSYEGRPVLTYWRGDYTVPPGFGQGEYVILDGSYREVAVVRAGNGLVGDSHEFLITDDDTALITVYREATADGGQPVWEGVVQELDIASGAVLFEWHSLDHVSPAESMVAAPADPTARFAYFHINSVAPDGADALLVSARNTSAIYRIDRSTGQVLWRLGGKNSDFHMGAGTNFAWQHDARRLADGTLSLFNNAVPQQPSRGLVLELDEHAMTAELRRAYTRPQPTSSASQGNTQVLPDGQVMVGWGSQPYVTEFDASGVVQFDATFGGAVESYRAFRSSWTGTPIELPAAAAVAEDIGTMSVYASWNGATEVVTWRIMTGPEPDNLTTVTETARAGFETRATVHPQQPYAAVTALDPNGAVLATSKPVATQQ